MRDGKRTSTDAVRQLKIRVSRILQRSAEIPVDTQPHLSDRAPNPTKPRFRDFEAPFEIAFQELIFPRFAEDAAARISKKNARPVCG
jgi:hypothetical protein